MTPESSVRRRRCADVTPAWGAEVMGTGIVAVGLHLAGRTGPSRIVLAVAGLVWVVLAVVFFARLGADRPEWRREAATPAALTAVAGTGVLGVGVALLGRTTAAAALLAAAALVWVVLLPRVLRNLQRRVPGAAYLVTVGTQSVAVLSATLAVLFPAHWLVWPAGVLLVLGVALYALVLTRFDFGQLRAGAGDHWVVAGALSISALACGKVTAAAAPHAAEPPRPLRWATLALLAAALGWYAVLVGCEVRWPRLRYDVRRWSTVFPLGMTAVSTMTAGTVCGVPWLHTLGEVLLWPAVAVWAVVGIGALRRITP
ncbi:tellurite resistance/C4-dicarboxylate transporter family protein [Actinomadura atramentaria]|uniref:tellurite resistance/C4-dicarboxylate transporter family protein n=1 Tax=Actinomadura atramentaria TaxID=1990 RepID=UPI00036BDA67|nr:tellurite resistance/C4-dicarboxylate transporter family protein [Actinomadura atramentaria]